MEKRRKIIIGLVLLGVIVLGLGGVKLAGELMTLREYRQIISEMTIRDVDLSGIEDGTYNGRCEAVLVAAEVAVTVKDHRIADIRLVSHQNGKGGPAEVIPQRVLEKQSLSVDMVSGATSSSKVILKAIENALESRAVD